MLIWRSLGVYLAHVRFRMRRARAVWLPTRRCVTQPCCTGGGWRAHREGGGCHSLAAEVTWQPPNNSTACKPAAVHRRTLQAVPPKLTPLSPPALPAAPRSTAAAQHFMQARDVRSRTGACCGLSCPPLRLRNHPPTQHPPGCTAAARCPAEGRCHHPLYLQRSKGRQQQQPSQQPCPGTLPLREAPTHSFARPPGKRHCS